ncbi:MAG: hypothetical protein AABZ55_15075 [Bdellovibrionota bacterium]
MNNTLLRNQIFNNDRGEKVMNTNKNTQGRSTLTTAPIAVMLIVLTGSGCFQIGNKDSDLLAGGGVVAKSGGSDALPVTDIGADPFATLSIAGTTAVKNFMQIGESMSVVTGVSSSDNTAISGLSIKGFIAANQGSFSDNGRADSVSASMLKSIATLAGLYCGRSLAIEKAAAVGARKVYKSVTFPGTLTSLTPAVIASLNSDLALAFWQRQASAAEQASLNTLITQVLAQTTSAAAATLSAAQRHDNAVLSACVAVLSSLDFYKS